MARPRKQAATEFAILDENDEPLGYAEIQADMGVDAPARPVARPVVTHAALSSAAPPAALAAPHVATAGPGRYFVQLHCPTTIQHKDGLEVEAANEDDARQRFCDANNISGSDHEWTIRRVG